jgi:hypothetical protein
MAAMGLMVMTGSASVYHLFRNEIGSAVFALILFTLATFIAYMRWKVNPRSSRITA